MNSRSGRTIALIIAVSMTAAGSRAADFDALTPLPQGFYGHALVRAGGYLYHLGGIGSAEGVFAARKTYVTPITGKARIGAWTAGPAFPEPIFMHAAVAANGFVYVIGGQHFNRGVKISPAVYFSRIGADGALADWQTASPLPQGIFLHSAAAWNGALYVTGGWGAAGLSGKVHSAVIQADGTLSPWTELAPLPEAVYTHATVQDGTLYVLGGVINGGAQMDNGVYFARIRADRTLEPWQETTPLADPLSSHSAAVVAGRIYISGGWTGDAATDTVHSAPIRSDKAVGDWAPAPSLPGPLYLHASAAADDALFISGGSNGSSYQSTVYGLAVATQLVATMVISPNTLNLASQGKYVTCRIGFPASAASAADVVPASLRITGVNGAPVAPIPAEDKPTSLDDDDGDGILERMVKFDRAALQAVLQPGDARIQVEGLLSDGRAFQAEDTIWAIAPSVKSRSQRVLGSSPLPAVPVSSAAALGIVSKKGGRVGPDARTGVDFPADAADGLPVTVTADGEDDPAELSRRETARGKKTLAAAGPAVEFGPEGATFSKPVTLSLAYDPDRLPAGSKEDDLQVHYWNAGAGEWEALASVVDKPARKVRAQTGHFSLYQVLTGAGPAAGPNIPGLAFDQVYAFPNPARRGAAPTLHIEASQADRLELRIYDIAGELVHSAEQSGPAPSVDDGSGRGAVPAFEYAWDASGAGSGIYIFVVTAHKAGAGSIRTSGKLALIR